MLPTDISRLSLMLPTDLKLVTRLCSWLINEPNCLNFFLFKGIVDIYSSELLSVGKFGSLSET